MPSTLNPNIPNGLEQIIMRAMALDTNDRYASATEMLKDMEEFRKDPSVLFLFPGHGVTGETKILPSGAAVTEAARKQTLKTTAERKAQTAAGAAGAAAAARARAAGDRQRMERESLDPPRLRPGNAETARHLHAAEAAAAATVRGNRDRLEPQPRRTREEIREEIREEERNRMATIAVVTCSIVAIIAIVIFLALLVNGVLFNQNESLVLVGNFVGEYYEDVSNTRGLEVVIGDSRHDATVEKGKILEQRPAYGSEVVQGSKVTVIVSLGPEPEPTKMESLIGYDYRVAEDFLRDLGLKPLSSEEFSDTVSAGKVIRTDPVAGAPLTEGQTVKIYYSKGPLIETAEMPNVVGKDYDTAYNTLINLGFSTVTYERRESNEPKDEVIAQSVEAGEDLDLTEKIVLTISKGPKETEPPKEDKEENKDKDKDEDKDDKPAEKPKEEVTKTVSIQLPTDREEDFVVAVHQNGTTVVEDIKITAGTASVDVTLTGAGTEYFDIYINDSYFRTEKVEFS